MKDLVGILNQFLVPEFGDDLILDFVDPSPEDVKQKLEIYKSGYEGGWITQNEIRAKEGLLPIEGGDVPLVDKKLNSIVGLGLHSLNQRTVLLNQPFVNDIFEGRSEIKRSFRIKELEVDLNKQYKERMADMPKKRKRVRGKERSNLESIYKR